MYKLKNLFLPVKGNVMFYLFLFLLVFIPLYPKFPLANIEGTYVAIRLEDVLVLLIVGAIFLRNLANIKSLLNKTISKSFLLFFLIGILSVISGIFITFTVTPHFGALHLFRRMEYISLFFAALLVIKNQEQVKLLLFSMLLVAVVVILYGLGQIYLGFGVISTVNKDLSKGIIVQLDPGSRLNSTFAGHYDLAIFMSYVLVFLASFCIYLRKYWQKGLLIVLSGVSLFILALTAARVSFVATVLSTAAVFWLSGKKLLIIALVFVSIVAVAAVPNLRDRFMATLNVNILQQGGDRYVPDDSEERQVNNLKEDLKEGKNKKQVTPILEEEGFSTKSAGLPVDIVPGEPTNYTELEVSRSLDIRLEVEWPRAIASFTKNPLLGTGYSSLTLATDNDYLRALGETGILGALSLLLVFFIIVMRFMSSLTKDKSFKNAYIVSCLGVLACVGLTATFLDILEASKVASLLWGALGVGWAMTEFKEYEQD